MPVLQNEGFALNIQNQIIAARENNIEITRKVSYIQKQNSINKKQKLSLKSIHNRLIQRHRNSKLKFGVKISKLQIQISKYDNALGRIFTFKQKKLLLEGESR
jgi:hypothetical protein